MHGGIVVTENQEGEKRTLNKSKPEMNRGVELLLRNRRKMDLFNQKANGRLFEINSWEGNELLLNYQ